MHIEGYEGEESIVYDVFQKCEKYDGGKGLFIDIGAHVGGASIWAVLHGFKKVIAIEPCASNFMYLLRNVVSNHVTDKVIPLFGAWSSKSMKDFIEVRHNQNDNSGQNGTLFLNSFPVINYAPVYSSGDILSLTRNEPIDFLKIDVESEEYRAFGDPDTLKLIDTVKYLDLELHGVNEGYYSSDHFIENGFSLDAPNMDMLELLKKHGFLTNLESDNLNYRGYNVHRI